MAAGPNDPDHREYSRSRPADVVSTAFGGGLRGCDRPGRGVSAAQRLRQGGDGVPIPELVPFTALRRLYAPGLRLASAVRVTRATAVTDRPRSASPRGCYWPQHLDPGDRTVPQVHVESSDDRRCQEPHLGRPGGGVGAHHELGVGVTLRRAVSSHVSSHDQVPPAEDGVGRQVATPPMLCHQPIEGSVEGLRVAVVWVRP